MPIRMLKKEKKPAGFKSTQQKGNIVKGKLKSQKELKDIMKSDEYKKSDYEGKTKMLNVATHKAGGLTGNQHKLDKNKDGKISGEDFKMMKAKKGKMASDRDRRQKEITEKQNPISEYDKKGKLKYTAAKKGAMMNKSTRGYGAARTSGMGLQDEQVKPGKVQKASLGALALGIAGKKLMDKKGKKMPLGLGAAALLDKKKKEILGKKTGGPISGPKGRLPRMSDMDKKRIDKFNRFRKTSTKGGGADSSKIMSDKTKQTIKNLVKRIGRLTPTGRAGSDAGKILKEKLKKKIMTPAKKMGGGMMMKQYNKGGSVTASCKLGRNKATKLY